jgi:ketosteroid isomerase-like protein
VTISDLVTRGFRLFNEGNYEDWIALFTEDRVW